MGRRKKVFPAYEKVEIIDAGSEGKAIARIDDLVIFIPFVVPGDVVDIQVVRKKKSFYEARAIRFHKYSDCRTEPFCKHFGTCGGCKWQHMEYAKQLEYKQKQVEDNFRRIGKFHFPELVPILASEYTDYYRNKLEYTFSNRRWLTNTDIDVQEKPRNMNALGFHIPGMFDRVLNIEHCWLQEEPSNDIRLAVRDYALKNELEFYDVKKWTGFLRNLIIRNTSTGELMVIVVFRSYDKEKIEGLLQNIVKRFPAITSLMYVINEKKNDIITDLDIQLFSGRDHIIESVQHYQKERGVLKFKIGPVSFFQTNISQAVRLFRTAVDFAEPTNEDIVYDLYTGTGTIANFIAGMVKEVIGIEYVPSSINDAIENSKFNNISNTRFYDGDIAKILDDEFVANNGKPRIIITDPPRAGMHEKVVKQIVKINPEKIIYISCNPATQARDIALMDSHFKIDKIQPVDMFPHTHHVENVTLLTTRG